MRAPLQLAHNPALEACSDLLGVGGTALSLALTRKRIATPSETITKVSSAVGVCESWWSVYCLCFFVFL